MPPLTRLSNYLTKILAPGGSSIPADAYKIAEANSHRLRFVRRERQHWMGNRLEGEPRRVKSGETSAPHTRSGK